MTCEQCGTTFDGRAGQRFCARPCRNTYWNAHYQATRQPRQRAERPARQRARPAGSQTWLTDPTVRVCPVDGCHFDHGSCEHKT